MQDDFQYGPLARGAYIALLWSTTVLGFVAADADWALRYLPWHLLLLVFLGIGLKPFVLRTGLYRMWQGWAAALQTRRNAGHHAEAARRVDRARRDQKLRSARLRDPTLPPRW